MIRGTYCNNYCRLVWLSAQYAYCVKRCNSFQIVLDGALDVSRSSYWKCFHKNSAVWGTFLIWPRAIGRLQTPEIFPVLCRKGTIIAPEIVYRLWQIVVNDRVPHRQVTVFPASDFNCFSEYSIPKSGILERPLSRLLILYRNRRFLNIDEHVLRNSEYFWSSRVLKLLCTFISVVCYQHPDGNLYFLRRLFSALIALSWECESKKSKTWRPSGWMRSQMQIYRFPRDSN